MTSPTYHPAPSRIEVLDATELLGDLTTADLRAASGGDPEREVALALAIITVRRFALSTLLPGQESAQ